MVCMRLQGADVKAELLFEDSEARAGAQGQMHSLIVRFPRPLWVVRLVVAVALLYTSAQRVTKEDFGIEKAKMIPRHSWQDGACTVQLFRLPSGDARLDAQTKYREMRGRPNSSTHPSGTASSSTCRWLATSCCDAAALTATRIREGRRVPPQRRGVSSTGRARDAARGTRTTVWAERGAMRPGWCVEEQRVSLLDVLAFSCAFFVDEAGMSLLGNVLGEVVRPRCLRPCGGLSRERFLSGRLRLRHWLGVAGVAAIDVGRRAGLRRHGRGRHPPAQSAQGSIRRFGAPQRMGTSFSCRRCSWMSTLCRRANMLAFGLGKVRRTGGGGMWSRSSGVGSGTSARRRCARPSLCVHVTSAVPMLMFMLQVAPVRPDLRGVVQAAHASFLRPPLLPRAGAPAVPQAAWRGRAVRDMSHVAASEIGCAQMLLAAHALA